MKFVICVTFTVVPDRVDDFVQLVTGNAKASLELEEGCLHFDVCVNEDTKNEIFLYEIYKTPEDFQAHLQTGHFRQFDAAVADMVADKTVKAFQLVN